MRMHSDAIVTQMQEGKCRVWLCTIDRSPESISFNVMSIKYCVFKKVFDFLTFCGISHLNFPENSISWICLCIDHNWAWCKHLKTMYWKVLIKSLINSSRNVKNKICNNEGSRKRKSGRATWIVVTLFTHDNLSYPWWVITFNVVIFLIFFV